MKVFQNMKWSLLVTLLVTLIFSLVSSQQPENSTDNGTQNIPEIEGTNMCGPEECFCLTEPIPIEIQCEGAGLQLMYEQSDWLATIEALNISSNTTLSARFSENQITELPRFPPLPIVMLILTKNKISFIDNNAFAELNQLEVLDLSHNNLTGSSLTEAVFTGPSQQNQTEGNFDLSIKVLKLSHNRIHSIGKDVFDHMPYLKSLDLSHNPLKTMEGSTSVAISSLRNLEFLSLAYTMIDGMHKGMLHDLNKLTSLDLSGNQFTKVPEELRWTHALEVLTLDNNKFEALDHTSFMGLDVLEDLSLSGNEKLRTVEEGTFGWLKKLEKLDMSHCKRLETLSDGAFLGLVEKENETDWPVKDIRLNDNGLSQIDEGLAPWDHVDYIDIRNNPFRCDCNLEWMMNVMMPKIEKISPSLTQGINCSQPKAMRGKSLNELMLEPELFSRCRDSKDELFPEEISLLPNSSYRAAGIAVIVIGVILVAVGLSLVLFLVIKRRAIAKALVAHQEIRYERADSDDDGIGSIHHTTKGANNRRTDVF